MYTDDTQATPIVFPCTCPAAYAFVVALVAAQSKEARRVWAVADALPMQERVAAELPLWGAPGIFVPEREIHVNNGLSDPDLAAERLEALRAIAATPQAPQVVVVTAAALNQSAPAFAQAAPDTTVSLKVGSELSPESLCARLTQHDFERVEQVTARGQWSLRGGILDVYPLQSAWPLRIEFFGDEVESIRAFDIDSQLSFRKLAEAELVLDEPPSDRRLRDLIAPQDWVIALPGSGESGHVLVFETPPEVADIVPELDELHAGEALSFYGEPLGSFDTGDFVMQEARRALARNSLLQWREQKWRVVMYFPHEGEKKRFEEICGEDDAWRAVQSRDGDLPCEA